MAAWSINNSIRTPLLLLGMGELLVLFSSVYVGALILYGSIENCENVVGRLEPRALGIAFVMLISLISMGLYDFHQRINFREILVRITVGFALGISVLAAVSYAFPAWTVAWEVNS